jgi:hypothetical protein
MAEKFVLNLRPLRRFWPAYQKRPASHHGVYRMGYRRVTIDNHKCKTVGNYGLEFIFDVLFLKVQQSIVLKRPP